MKDLKGTKIVEVPYFAEQLTDSTKSVLIVGERFGGIEGVSEAVHNLNYKNVNTTDILPSPKGSWLKVNTQWEHIECDFIEFDESKQYDNVISVSVFEHFGFWFAGDRMANGLAEDDVCRWNHDLLGINKACKLLKDAQSKLMITLPAGPYMNYEESGEPFLRYYDARRQKLIHSEVQSKGYNIVDEKFYFSQDFTNWDETSSEINDPKYYPYYNIHSPNVIWAFTIQKQQ